MKAVISWLDGVEGTPILKGYGYSYTDFLRAYDIYYPLPINYIVRYWRECCWGFIRFFYRVGLIDIGEAQLFRWADFYRIKTH